MSPDVRLYLVGGDVGTGRTLVDVVADAVAGGVTIVQVREKDAGAGSLTRTTRELADRLSGTGVPVLVNDDPQVARTAGADGVHLGPDDPHPVEARELLGPDAVIGWSVHEVGQLGDRAALLACDYLAASPVWATPTKTDTTPPLEPDGVADLRRRMPAQMPLTAIGGIDAGNAAQVVEAGADGVAVVSAICAATDPRREASRLRDVVDAALERRRRR